MTSRSRRPRPFRPLTVLTLLAVLAAGLAVGAGSFGSPAAAGGYTPPAGVRTNNPLGDRAARRAIISQIIRSTNSAPRKSKIRIASWNIRSDDIVDALIRAHRRRHISVRVVMDRGNANAANPNKGVNRLERALHRYGNDSRRPEMRSGLTRCVSACRGRRGIAHSKFFLFQRSGKARYVVMNGSANATDLAATGQWNDLYTVKGRRGIYREYLTVFNQMYRDRPVRQGYRVRHFGGITTMFYPYTGTGTSGDPVRRELDRVSCSGARNTSDGRTRIRIAMTSWHGERGKSIAWRVRRMQNHGCHIRIVYAVMGNEVLRILRHEGPSPVPMRQIVQDFNGDGVYDRYLHMKVLTVRGVYGRNHSAWMTLNGSANWSPVVLASDEALMRIDRPRVVRRYNGWIDYLFSHPPRSSKSTARMAKPGVNASGVDPYSLIQVD